MSNVQVEGHHAAEWLLSELPGHQSRETAVLVSGAGNNLPSGRVLGRVSSTGKLTELAPTAGDGSENAAAILWDNTDASAADRPCVAIARGAEVKDHTGLAANDLASGYVSISYPSGISGPQKTAAIAQLAALGIIVRS